MKIIKRQEAVAVDIWKKYRRMKPVQLQGHKEITTWGDEVCWHFCSWFLQDAITYSWFGDIFINWNLKLAIYSFPYCYIGDCGCLKEAWISFSTNKKKWSRFFFFQSSKIKIKQKLWVQTDFLSLNHQQILKIGFRSLQMSSVIVMH